MTLKEITRRILSEGVSNDEINDAINNHKYIVVTYEGTDGTHNQNRMIQPVAFGCTKAGNPVVRAYETFGDTKTFVPRWKFLRVDRISSWRDTGKTFSEPAQLFNPHGDKTMKIVFNIAKFDDEEENTMQTAPTSSPKRKEDAKPNIYKTETERKLEKLRKQLNNPITLSDLKTQNGFGSYKDKPKSTGPKTNQNAKNVNYTDYGKVYNYNALDNPIRQNGTNKNRLAYHYYQKRDSRGRFTKGYVYDEEPMEDDSKYAEEYLNRDNGNREELENLRKQLGDTSNPISFRELQKRLGKK